MNKLKFSFLLLMFLTSVPVFADYAPVNVQEALKKMYPEAKDVAWTRDEAYYVADFILNGFDTKVWFNANASWAMKQTDWETMDEVPPAVYNAFAASQYSDGMVQDVTLVQFPEKQSVISVIVGMANTQTRYQLLFTPDGSLEDERNATYFNNLLGAEVFLNS
ncbi:PepSY-like domain-containing protein [Bacteroides oleiciplenus]|uniref:Putative beta-lactamase-inhibitor-like PepSY-like domain-containing protein n=1 Tax=Bacteroides oleiciplenus TaxID=626931 RepID=A0A3E5B5X1_9BACE|nr:PepSY-like domain-containing protein [Bacteroides oleiciplenus]RGN33010.1 hypothetical protein DXB65_17470 [Bacteroides oleiciplenus]